MRGDATSLVSIHEAQVAASGQAIIQADPAVVTCHRLGGRRRLRPFGSGGASANVTMTLKPLAERRISADQVIARLRPKLNKVTGVSPLFCRPCRTSAAAAAGRANSQYQYTCSAMI
jgi:multidrug efflux pump